MHTYTIMYRGVEYNKMNDIQSPVTPYSSPSGKCEHKLIRRTFVRWPLPTFPHEEMHSTQMQSCKQASTAMDLQQFINASPQQSKFGALKCT